MPSGFPISLLRRVIIPATTTATAELLRVRQLASNRRLNPCKSILTTLRLPPSFLYSIIFQCILPQHSVRDVALYACSIIRGNPSNFFPSFVAHLGCHGHFEELSLAFQRLSGVSGEKLPAECCNSLLGFCCDGDDSKVGMEVLMYMEENGVEVGKGKYRDLYYCCCRNGNVNGADMLLKRIAELEGLALDFRICEGFLLALCLSGKLREAHKLFDKMRRKNGTFNHASDGKVRPGRRVIFQMGPLLGVKEKTVALDVFFWLLCKARRVDEAERLWKGAGHGGLTKGRSIASFVEALFGSGRVEDAVSYFEAEKRRGNENIGKVAGMVVVGLCQAGRIDDGIKVMHQFTWSNDCTNLRVWNHVLKCLWDFGRDQEAKNMFRSRELHNGPTYETMIHGLLHQNEFLTAMSFMGKMVVNGIMGSERLYCAVASWLYWNRNEEEALRYVDFMVENEILASYAAWEACVDSIMALP